MSNLLDKSSLVLTPTAYNNGKILSVKPAPSLSSELVTNGGFDTDSGWTKQTSWSISGGAANYDFLSDAKYIRQTLLSGGFVAGKVYKINFDITSGTAYMNVSSNGGGLISLNTYSVGSYSIQVTASANGSDLLIYGRNTSGTAFSIDNVSVKQVIDGDFDFTRNSSATRVNSQGLIEDVQILSSNLVSNGDFSQEGSELVTNGDFATDSNWNKGANWSILNGVATSNGAGLIQQSTSDLTPGKTYKISFEITEYTSGGVKLYSGSGSDASTYKNTVGTHTDTLVLNGNTTSLYSNNFIGSIDNVSVKEVGQDWTLGTGITIGENKAIFTSTASGQSVLQNAVASSLTNGSLAKVSFEVLSRTQGSFGVYFSGTLVGTLASAGVFTGYFTKGTETSFYIRALGTTSGSISNISVIEITEDTNLPRIDYTGGTGHWLFEPQSTNLITYSSDFSNASYSKANAGLGSTPIVTPDYATSPSGSQDADRIQFNLNSGTSSGDYSWMFTFPASDINGIVSIYLKTNDNTTKVVYFRNTFGTIDNITVTGNWQRYSIVNTATRGFYIGLRGAQGNSDTADLSVWGAQVEAQTFATSIIPTSGSQITRLQDAAFGAGSSDLINSTEGVLYGEIAKLQDINDSYRLISMTNNASNSANNSVTIGFSNSNKFYFRIAVNGVSILSSTSTLAATKNQYYKVAIKFNALGDNAVWIDGIEVLSNTTSFTYPIIMDNLSFNYNGNGGLPFYGKTKCLAVFKEALTDAELTCLTTI